MQVSFARVADYQAAGYYVAMVLSYEAAQAFDHALACHLPGQTPLAWFAVFKEISKFTPTAKPFTLSAPSVSISESEYTDSLKKVLNHIHAGDIYQANVTIRARCDFSGDPFSAFCYVQDAVPMPYAAYADLGHMQVLSFSPELFLEQRGDLLISKPMKGTAPRKPSWGEDERARLELQQSEKDRAENTMIVDLMRNDLGRVCKTGSIKTQDEYHVERFPTVHQMTTTVTGIRSEHTSLFDIFCATFPAGSITGAPKVRASQIIKEIETTPRGVYCGSIGLFYPGRDFICNVAIRTLELNGSVATLGIGSGIVADSNPEREWEEALLKSKFVQSRKQDFGLYEAFRYVPESGYRNLEDHLARLERSCIYFGRPFPRDKILCKLEQLRSDLGDKPNRVRLDLKGEDISFTLIPEELAWPEDGVTVMIPDVRLDPEDPRLYHKTTDRPEKYLFRAKAKELGADECLFLNTRSEFTEGTISSAKFKLEGRWITPELSCGLLPGVWRDHQVHENGVAEAVVTLDNLKNIEAICMGNSVRGEGRVKKVITEDGAILFSQKVKAK
jgi:para-aminobenzoate synthetase/4-amino-4-deoxychorismate lyase